ncbi:MAG: hypothetical protein M1385_00080 [Candidatus Marsarchaeota archaeon]|nr:hypothetical protein [Candidatus Marsarchaeota archaeon]
MIKRLYIVLFFFLFSAILSMPLAQIGEVAGPVNFNVSAGSSQSLSVTIVNGGNNPLFFNATPIVTTLIANEITPTVTVFPKNGTIGPHSQAVLNLTTFVPGSDKPGLEWNGQLSVVSNSLSTITGSGAIIQEGALKIFTITSAQPKFNILFVILIIVIVVILIVVFYYFYKKRANKRKGAHKSKAKK